MATRVLHIITGLRTGGAETMLCRTVESTDPAAFEHAVICLTDEGDLADRLRLAGADFVAALHITSPVSLISGFHQMRTLIRDWKPALVQCWLAHAMLLGSLAAKLAGNPPVLWAIHSGVSQTRKNSWQLAALSRLLPPLAHLLPERIVSCSATVREFHCHRGFPRRKMELIANGTDTARFYPDPEAGHALREELGIPEAAPVIGIVGRLTPEKDFATFFRACLHLQRRLPRAHFVLCGRGLDRSYQEGREWMARSPRPSHFHLIGPRSDMLAVYNALDCAVLTSVSEAFPLVLGEAMACGVPCVATQVGDCRQIIGNTGRLTRPGVPRVQAEIWEEILTLPALERQKLGARARERVERLFSMPRCMQSYEALYRSMRRPPHHPLDPSSNVWLRGLKAALRKPWRPPLARRKGSNTSSEPSSLRW